MLASRIMQIGCNPLLHFLLKRQQPEAEFAAARLLAILSTASTVARSSIARWLPTSLTILAAFGITDRIDRRIKLASASAEGKAVPVTNRPSLGQACIAGRANGFRVLLAHAVRNCFFDASIEIPSEHSKAGFMLS